MSSDAASNITRRAALSMAGAAFVLPAAPLQSRSLEKRRMTFAPKFIDLVRNYTTTNGTNDFDLGPAVNGFASFADVCAAGDTFYYSATGIDNPSEYEVGRGTFQSNGKISRDPISGTKTDFSSGNKSIALVAAAEWFAAVDRAQASPMNVKSFGAKGDGAPDGSSGTDDTAAIQAALDHLGSQGGGTLYFPEGIYLVSSYLTVPMSVILKGAGRRATIIAGTHAGGGGADPGEDLRNGSIFFNPAPVNATTQSNVTIESLRLSSVNGANQGAGFYQQSGTLVTLRDCELGVGCKWGVVLDQSEDVLMHDCVLVSDIAGGAGLWIVNGSDLRPTASFGFTNIIVVRDSQVNVVPTSYGVVDDGGYTHVFEGCNFVSGINAMRASGVNGLTISNYYCESQQSDVFVFADTTLSGMQSSGVAATMIGGWATRYNGSALVKGLASPGQVRILGVYSNDSGKPLIQNAAQFNRIMVSAMVPGDPPLTDGDAIAGTLDFNQLLANTAGKIGIPNVAGTSGGITLSPGMGNGAGFIESFDNTGARQSYGFYLNGTAVQFAAQNRATNFLFLDPVNCTGTIKSTGGGIGYGTGAGGVVAQATSKSSGVTLNKPAGQITMTADALAPATTVSFKLTNNQLGAGDVLILNHVSGGTFGSYSLNAHGAATGSVTIDVTNISAAALSEPIVIGFAIMKAVTA